MWHGLEFAFPEAAYGVAALVFLWISWAYLRAHRRKALGAFGGPGIPRSRLMDNVRFAGLSVAWLMGCVVLMQPKGNARYLDDNGQVLNEEVLEERLEKQEDGPLSRVKRKVHDIIFLLDASASMSVSDTRTGVARLDYAKEIIDQITSRLDGQQVALYAFTAEPVTVVPATNDYLFLRLMLKRVGINEGDVAGTDLLEAFEGVRHRHLRDGAEKKRTVILLSDGGDTRLERLSAEDREKEVRAIASRLGDAAEKNLRLFAIGLGTKAGEVIPNLEFNGEPVRSSLDETLLRRLSQDGRGRYYFANAFSAVTIADDIMDILQQDGAFVEEGDEQLSARLERKVENEKEKELIYDEYFQWPLALGLLGLAAFLWLPAVRRLAVVAAFLGTGTLAANDVQKAEQLFEAKFYEQSIEKYQRLDLNKYSRDERTRIKYNIATNHLHLGHWDEARKQFRDVIAQNPNDPDLMRRATFSLGLAFLWEGQEKAGRLHEDSDSFLGDVDQAITVLRAALQAHQAALEKDRELAVILGRDREAEDLEELRTSAKEALALVLERKKTYQLQKIPLKDGLQQLADQLSQSVERLELVGRRSSGGKEQRRFLTELAIAGKTQSALWGALAKRFEQEDEGRRKTFADAQNFYLTALDLMRDGELWKSRDAQSAAVLSIALLRLQEEKKDGLAWLLQQRIALRNKGRDAKSEPQWKRSLLEEDALLSDLGKQLTAQLREQVLTESDKSMEEESQRMELRLQAKMLDLLAGRISAATDLTAEEERHARVDGLFYEQIQETEGQTLLQAYQSAQKLKATWAGELSEAIPQRSAILDRLRILQQKLEQRRFLITDVDEQNKAKKVMEVLGKTEEYETGAWEPLTTALEEALLIWDPSKILLAKLGELADAYFAAREENPPKPVTLTRLIEGLDAMAPLIQLASENAINRQPFQQLSLDLKEARQATQTAENERGNTRTVRTLLGDGKQWIRRGVDRLTKPQPADSQWILKKGIAEQTYAIELNRLADSETLLKALLGAQGFVLQSVNDFQESVPEENQSQAPWDEVFPLFKEGLHRAEQAHAHLGVGLTELNQALNHQGEALRLWREALEKLQKNQDDDNSDDQGESPPPPPESDEGSPEEGEEQQGNVPDVSPDELFDLLQQMDKDDQLPPEKQAPTKKGLRPW